MAELLQDVDLERFETSDSSSTTTPPAFVTVGESVLLKSGWAEAKDISPSKFPDRTGFECFVNHVHLPLVGEAQLVSTLHYVFQLRRALRGFGTGRNFRVIFSASDWDSAVRFHELRPSESWLADDLESYLEEAILTVVAFDDRKSTT